MEDVKAAARQQVYECSVCSYLYNYTVGDVEHGIPAGIPFEELPLNWVCPICGASRELTLYHLSGNFKVISKKRSEYFSWTTCLYLIDVDA